MEVEQCSIPLNLQKTESLCDSLFSNFSGVPDTGIPPIPEIYNIFADEFREMLDLAKDSGSDNGNEMR